MIALKVLLMLTHCTPSTRVENSDLNAVRSVSETETSLFQWAASAQVVLRAEIIMHFYMFLPRWL